MTQHGLYSNTSCYIFVIVILKIIRNNIDQSRQARQRALTSQLDFHGWSSFLEKRKSGKMFNFRF